MDEYQVELTAGAEIDLEELVLSALERAGEKHAQAVLKELEDAIESLALHPLRRAVPPQLQALGILEFRQMLVETYRLLFRVQDRRVLIVLIAHQKRDFRSLLERRLLR